MTPDTIDALISALERFKRDLESPAVVTVSEASRRVGRRRGSRWVIPESEIPRLYGGIV